VNCDAYTDGNVQFSGSLKWSFKVENYTYQADDSLFQVSLVIGQVFPTDPRYVSCKNNFEVQDFERHCNLSGAIFESGLQDLNVRQKTPLLEC
jgi:hypothetical protein